MSLLRVFVFITLSVFISHSNAFGPKRVDRSKDTLQLVHLIFRHGERSHDISTTYPNDPYKNETYYPYGLGQLTNQGKQTEYSLGKKLRRRFDSFLGDVYTPDILDAFSTEIDRAKVSLQLVLAGLFPPKNTPTDWEHGLNWQPIPYKYLTFDRDHMMSFPHLHCANYPKISEAYLNSPKGRKIEQKYAEIYPYLTEHTGQNVTSTYDLRLIYFGLRTQAEWGFVLPAWTKAVFPNPMEKGVIDFFKQSTATPELKQRASGFLLKKIITDTKLKLNGELNPQSRKMFLYSGHETNIGFALNTLGVYEDDIPPYGACIIIEVHKIDGVNGIKVYYEDYSQKEPKLLRIPGCDEFCPFPKFTKLMEKNLPIDDNACDEELSVLPDKEMIDARAKQQWEFSVHDHENPVNIPGYPSAPLDALGYPTDICGCSPDIPGYRRVCYRCSTISQNGIWAYSIIPNYYYIY